MRVCGGGCVRSLYRHLNAAGARIRFDAASLQPLIEPLLFLFGTGANVIARATLAVGAPLQVCPAAALGAVIRRGESEAAV